MSEPFGAERSAELERGARSSAPRREPPPPPAAAGAPLPGPPPLRARPDFFSPCLPHARAPAWPNGASAEQPTPGPGAGDRVNTRLHIPDDAHVTVRALWAAMRLQGMRIDELAARSHVSVQTLENWRSGFSLPRMEPLERALAVVGLQLTVEPRPRG